MKLKNFTLKTFTVLAFMLLAFAVNAQVDQPVPLGDPTTYNYTVDTDPANGGGPTPIGTPGSTYVWTIEDDAAPTAVLTSNGNTASINWSAVPVGIYHVRVDETNASCPTETVFFEIHVIQPNNPILTWADAAPICEGDPATFEITGAPAGAIISFTVTGGTAVANPVTASPLGEATITVNHDGNPATTQIVVTLTSMNVGGNVVTLDASTDPNLTKTAQVNIVQTSPIQLVP